MMRTLAFSSLAVGGGDLGGQLAGVADGLGGVGEPARPLLGGRDQQGQALLVVLELGHHGGLVQGQVVAVGGLGGQLGCADLQRLGDARLGRAELLADLLGAQAERGQLLGGCCLVGRPTGRVRCSFSCHCSMIRSSSGPGSPESTITGTLGRPASIAARVRRWP